MATPQPSPITPPNDPPPCDPSSSEASRRDGSPGGRYGEVHWLLVPLKSRPDQRRFAELYDLTSPTVYAWAVAAAPDRDCAATATVAAYLQVWRDVCSYPRQANRPWAWLQAATVHAVHQQRHHGWPAHH